jgi:hypothetical protein
VTAYRAWDQAGDLREMVHVDCGEQALQPAMREADPATLIRASSQANG